ncbi:MAG TPA: squalene synthase HpnC [Burkholderiaceae bacterium]|nr:squalene synthase HpnC [Burkholderiaceae bacterium]
MADHYENFPVASWLMPGALRPAVLAIYAFARHADDVADEGDASPSQRLAQLGALRRELDAIEARRATAWPALAAAVSRHGLPVDLLRDLLSAFEQDVRVTRYPDYPALLDYCRRSANPVGRLLLALYGCRDADAERESDAICTALQLINFWQDVAIDWAKGRVYLPQSELAAARIDEAQIAAGAQGPAWTALMARQVGRARALMWSGAPLARRLRGRLGWELRLVIQGGLRIAQRIDAVGGDVFRHRPTLAATDWLVVGARALTMPAPPPLPLTPDPSR